MCLSSTFFWPKKMEWRKVWWRKKKKVGHLCLCLSHPKRILSLTQTQTQQAHMQTYTLLHTLTLCRRHPFSLSVWRRHWHRLHSVVVKRENLKARKTDSEKNDDETRWSQLEGRKKYSYSFLFPEEIVGGDREKMTEEMICVDADADVASVLTI